MKRRNRAILFGFALFYTGLQIPAGKAQQDPQQANLVKAVHVIGLTGVKDNAKGTLSVGNGQLHFIRDKASTDISASSIQDVVAGAETQKAVGKTVGTVSMAAPYGGGRFLSLFRKKIDTLTIQYCDADGALHGVIFTTQPGTADGLKKDLVAQGANFVPTLEKGQTPANAPPNNSANREQKQ